MNRGKILVIFLGMIMVIGLAQGQVNIGESPDEILGVIVGAGSGIDFTDLDDTPSSISENFCVVGNADGTALSFQNCTNATIFGTFDNTNIAYLNNTQTFTDENFFSDDVHVQNLIFPLDNQNPSGQNNTNGNITFQADILGVIWSNNTLSWDFGLAIGNKQTKIPQDGGDLVTPINAYSWSKAQTFTADPFVSGCLRHTGNQLTALCFGTDVLTLEAQSFQYVTITSPLNDLWLDAPVDIEAQTNFLALETSQFMGDITADGNVTIGENLNVTGNISLGGDVITHNGCLIPHANFWAEESGSMNAGTSGGFQYSYGNGDVAGLGVIQKCDGRVVSIGIDFVASSSADGVAGISINKGASHTCNITQPNGLGGTASDWGYCDLSFSAGDSLTAKTITTPSGTGDGVVVSWEVVYD